MLKLLTMKVLRKIITSILGFFGIMAFTSCYGMPANYALLCGQVTGDNDGNPKTSAVPVAGIKVSVKDSAGREVASTTTDADGYYGMEIDKPSLEELRGDTLTFIFEDIDDEENGLYEMQTKTGKFTEDGGALLNVDVELKPKPKTEG